MLCRRTFRYVNYCPRALPCLSGNPPLRRSILTPFSPAVFAGGGGYTSSAHFPICILLPACASLSKRKSPSSEEHPHPLFPRCVCGWFGYASSAHFPICILLSACASLSKQKSPSSAGHSHPLFPRYLGAGNISCRYNVLLFSALRWCAFRYVNYCLRALPCLSENPPPRRGILTPFSPAILGRGIYRVGTTSFYLVRCVGALFDMYTIACVRFLV